MNKKTQKSLTFLGFDFGLKRIGIAVGQSITMSATPLSTINVRNTSHWKAIAKLITTWKPHALIVGIPVNMDGSEQPITKQARRFAKQLYDQFHLPVHQVDERLTTKAAREKIYETGGYKALQKAAIDSIAAKLILESWIRENYG
ncbi:MAG: Holliday junction resolvase [Coxiella sp. DG_40]|nr:MAG: Holliday junction resolvase [Coxiella sp. DG_40]